MVNVHFVLRSACGPCRPEPSLPPHAPARPAAGMCPASFGRACPAPCTHTPRRQSTLRGCGASAWRSWAEAPAPLTTRRCGPDLPAGWAAGWVEVATLPMSAVDRAASHPPVPPSLADCAVQHALNLGVGEVHVFVRRQELPRINPIRFMEFAGVGGQHKVLRVGRVRVGSLRFSG